MENPQKILDIISSLTLNFTNQVSHRDKTIIGLEHTNNILCADLSKSRNDNFKLQLEVDKLKNQLSAKQETYDNIISNLEKQTFQTEHDFRLFGKEINTAYNILERENIDLRQLVGKLEKKLELSENKYQELISGIIGTKN